MSAFRLAIPWPDRQQWVETWSLSSGKPAVQSAPDPVTASGDGRDVAVTRGRRLSGITLSYRPALSTPWAAIRAPKTGRVVLGPSL